MIYISHRGNLVGKDLEKENHPSYVLHAIEEGYEVEVDVWFKDDIFFLGHDKPQYEISLDFLINNKLWCHCKNIEALSRLLKTEAHCFFHNLDDFTLTSKGFIWTYPNRQLTKNSICVLPELGYAGNLLECQAICSDFIKEYKIE